MVCCLLLMPRIHSFRYFSQSYQRGCQYTMHTHTHTHTHKYPHTNTHRKKKRVRKRERERERKTVFLA